MDLVTAHSDPAEALTTSPELQLIYETAPIGLAFLSTDCRYVLINQHMTEICGISIAGHLGRTVRETVPRVADQVEQLVQLILRSGDPITGIEVNGQRPDGSNVERIWITYWHPLKSRSGKIIGINVAAEEITERKRAEADLAASRERLRALSETLAERVEAQARERDRIWNLSQDLLVVTDLSGRILNVNPAWPATLGWSSDELLGKTAEWLAHPDERERWRAESANLVAGRSTPHFESRLLCRDGSYRWLSWLAVLDREFIYAVARDITNLKQAEEQLAALRRQLAHASRRNSMTAMSASIAHEVKQPLAAIVSSANAGLRWLKRPEPDLAEVQAALEQIVKDGHRIDDVIASIRALLGKESRTTSPVDVPLLVREVIALVRGELEVHQIVLRNDTHDRLPEVMAERVQLQQVVLNLVMNAIEAMSSQTTRERHLTITSRVGENADVSIMVEDTGSGIDPAHLERIFDPFFTTKSNGMGLGLSICRSIVEAHGGRLWATPRRSCGTVFHLTLPSAGQNSGPTKHRHSLEVSGGA
ncbi:MAG TPA: PAS domain S-box protein [Xanthobacteraceae bacterium]